MKKKTSIHDIAKHLKVSATTVSFVLNGKSEEMRISADVKNKVLQYAESIRYQPNFVARSLRTGKSRIIGMMVEDISDPFFSSIARGIEHRAYTLGYKIFFASTENNTENAKGLIRVFRERQVDGYIIAPPPGLYTEIQSLVEEENPVILFDRHFPDLETDNVIVDNYDGSLKAVRHLQQNGYTNIGFVTLESDQTQMSDRMRGYLDAISATKQKKFILKLPYDMADEKRAANINHFISKHPQMDAVFFGTNYLAFSGLEAIKNLGLKIPEDLGVISFDDSNFFRLFSPAITAIAQPIDKIAESVISKLLQWLDNPLKATTETLVLPTELVVRNSSAGKQTKLCRKQC